MAINVDIQPAVPVVNNDTKDAVVIDSLTKIFKKSRPLLRWHKKNAGQKEEKREVRAVDNVTITIKRREIVGILGSNGSGKSTLIRILSTLLIPDSGHVTIFGYDVEKDESIVQRLINRVSVEASFFKKLSPKENLICAARLYNMPAAEVRDKLTTGLDPRSKLDVQTFVRELRDEHDATILLSTHDMDEAEALSDRVAIIDQGRIVALGDVQELKRDVSQLTESTKGVSMYE